MPYRPELPVSVDMYVFHLPLISLNRSGSACAQCGPLFELSGGGVSRLFYRVTGPRCSGCI
jgi:hypothetical protein